MNKIGRLLSVMTSAHTAGQKINYLKYLFSKRSEILNYHPLTISIVATGRCTLACDMCPTHSEAVPKDYQHIQKNVRDISFDMFKEMIDAFADALEVHIIGSGEPLLNKDFFRMVDYAASRGMTVKTFSNGTTIEKNLAAILGSKLAGMTISLNGHNPQEFARMTGEGEDVYENIYGATKRLIAERNKIRSNLKVKLSFIIDKHNYRYIPAMIKTAVALGADHIFLCNFLPAPYADLKASERVLTSDVSIVDELGFILDSLGPDLRRKVTPPVPVDEGSPRNDCDTHFTQIRFDGDGNVSSCSMMLLDMTGHGSYKDGDVWNNEFFRRMRKIFLKGDEEKFPEPCRICPDNKGIKIKG
jgi:MoaA/NifB/PqqE/SkfB family radical SAM enzyme